MGSSTGRFCAYVWTVLWRPGRGDGDPARRRSDEERQRVVENTLALPVSVVARKQGIAKSLLFRWRKEAGLTGKRKGGASNVPSFVPVRIEAAPNVPAPAAP